MSLTCFLVEKTQRVSFLCDSSMNRLLVKAVNAFQLVIQCHTGVLMHLSEAATRVLGLSQVLEIIALKYS